MAKKFESSAPLLKYSRRIRILSLARLGERKAEALAVVLSARSPASPAFVRGRLALRVVGDRPKSLGHNRRPSNGRVG
jgi:hypothetical protein